MGGPRKPSEGETIKETCGYILNIVNGKKVKLYIWGSKPGRLNK